MKKIIFSILFLTTLFTQGQDPSFSQFDLNMMYSNPAFVGYDISGRCTKSLLHSRNQWNGLNENLNNSIFEFSTSTSRNLNTSFSSGFGIISEDLRFKSEIGNTIFTGIVHVISKGKEGIRTTTYSHYTVKIFLYSILIQ